MRPWTVILVLCCLAIDAGAAPAAPAVTPAGAATIQRAIAAKKGRIVVVNFWATWCGPCVAEYPYLVKLQTQYGAKGVTVIAVSADMAKDIHSKVQPFLVRQKAMFPQYLERADDPQDFINAFDPKWQGDLPRTLIYDRQGRLAKTLSGGQTYAQFVAAVTPLLKP